MSETTNNLSIYNAVREVPKEAKKEILAGRIKGFTDINPMWRIKKITEQFGPCGIGWKYVITKQWTETVGNEARAFCNIDLFVKVDGTWSDAIPGTGGSSMITQEKNGLYFSDEAYKMALTDALSVAMKALGVGASVYFDRDVSSKYEAPQPEAAPQPNSMDEESHDLLEYYAKPAIQQANTKEELAKIYHKDYACLQKYEEFKNLLSARKKQLGL